MKRLTMAAVMLSAALAFAQGAGTTTTTQAPAPGQAAKTGTGKTQVTWWGHAAFVITTPGGANLAVDPWFTNPKAPKNMEMPKNLDAILVTHGHSDHVGETAALMKSNPNAKLITSFELATQLTGGKDMGANQGGTITVKDAKIHLVEAVHSSGYMADGKTISYGGNPLGFVIEIANGPTLYHAGDTDVFSSMGLIAERYKPTVAMLPIGGHFTMDPDGAAVATRMLKVKTVVPMHYGTFEVLTGTPAQLISALKAQKVSAKVVELKPGQTTSL